MPKPTYRNKKGRRCRATAQWVNCAAARVGRGGGRDELADAALSKKELFAHASRAFEAYFLSKTRARANANVTGSRPEKPT